MTNEITKKIKKVVDLVVGNYSLAYVELQFFNKEYFEVWNVLNENGILDIPDITVKLSFHDGMCRLIIGPGDLK